MLADYAVLGCGEVWNSARTDAYLANPDLPGIPGWEVGGCSCPELQAVLASDPDNFDAEYTTPDDPDHQAPWYDSNVPESASYYGFMPLSVRWLNSPFYRIPRETLNSGTVIGRERIRGRVLQVEGVLLGSRCLGVAYGLEVLQQQLRGCQGTCGGDCDGDTLQMFTCCPDSAADASCNFHEDVPNQDGTPPDYEDFLSRHLRCYRNVGLLNGPDIIEEYACGCGSCTGGSKLTRVSFQLIVGDPFGYTQPDTVLDEVDFPIDDGECVGFCDHNNQPANGCGSCDGHCPEGAECLVGDPKCASSVQPPEYLDPEGCGCTPLSVTTECHQIDSDMLSGWFDTIPVVTIYSGRTALRDIAIRFSPLPPGQTCDDSPAEDPCNGCSELRVSYLEAGQTIVLDGRTRRATVTCPGGATADGSPVLYGQNGAPLVQWPVLTCGDEGRYCVCIELGDTNAVVSDDAYITVELVGRSY